jgi:uncharacterized GH25 family protein
LLAAGVAHAEGAVIEGDVVDEDKRPVAGATVIALDPHPPPLFHGQPLKMKAKTNGRGHFRIEPAAAGALVIQGEAVDHLTPAQPTRLDTVEDQTAKVTLVLPRAASVKGVLVDEAGRAVGGALVVAPGQQRPNAPEDRNQGQCYTDPTDGSFEVRGLRTGPAELHVAAEGFPPASLTQPAPAAGVRWVLKRGAEVRGTVLDEKGKPLSDLQVSFQALQVGAQGSGSLEGKTDAAGAFSVREVPDGRYFAVAETEDHRTASARVEVASGKIAAALTLKFEPGQTATGQVVDAAGKPVADATVEAFIERKLDAPVGGWPDAPPFDPAQWQATTGADGQFTLAHLRAGTYSLRVTKEALAVEVPVKPGARGVKVVLK